MRPSKGGGLLIRGLHHTLNLHSSFHFLFPLSLYNPICPYKPGVYIRVGASDESAVKGRPGEIRGLSLGSFGAPPCEHPWRPNMCRIVCRKATARGDADTKRTCLHCSQFKDPTFYFFFRSQFVIVVVLKPTHVPLLHQHGCTRICSYADCCCREYPLSQGVNNEQILEFMNLLSFSVALRHHSDTPLCGAYCWAYRSR